MAVIRGVLKFLGVTATALVLGGFLLYKYIAETFMDSVYDISTDDESGFHRE